MAGEVVDSDRMADVIARLKRDRGWTQAQVAHAAGISLSTVSNWARGAGASVETAAKVLEAAGLPREHAIGPEDDRSIGQLDRVEAKLDELLRIAGRDPDTIAAHGVAAAVDAAVDAGA